MTVVALEATRVRITTATLLAGAVVIAAVLAAWWAGTPYVVGVWHDDGVYLLLGRAIASGQGFHYVQLPGAPAATHYPPAYPLLLAAIWRLAPSFPDNIAAFLAVNAMLAGAAAFGAYQFARQRLAWRDDAAAAVAMAAAVSTPMLTLAGAVLSEPLFLACLWPVLMIAERAVTDSGTERDAWTAGAMVGALMLVRTHAVALALALAIVLAATRRPGNAVRTLVSCAAVLLPWQIWSTLATPRVPAPLAGSYGSYLGWFVTGVRQGGLSFVTATVRLNLMELWLLLQDRVVPGDVRLLRAAATALLLGLVILGGWSLLRRARVTVLFLALYLAVVVVWPYSPWRFLWAVWPLVLLCGAAGAHRLWSISSTPVTRSVAALALALPAFGMVRTEWRAFATHAWPAPALAAGAQITPLIAWVGRNTRSSDVVLSEGEQVISLFTGRRAAPTAPFSASEYVTPRSREARVRELREMLSAVPANYVLPLAPVQVEAARALVGARPGLREVATLPSSPVYQVVR